MLSSWNILPEHENATPITLPTTEFEALGEHNEPSKWRRSMREHDEAREEPDTSDTKQELLRAPDGEALNEQNENASIATAHNHKIRLIQPKLNDEKFMEITQEMKELKIDPISLVVDGDPDAMTRAIQNGCDRESIEAIIEHANTLVFNDQACTRNQDFELQQSQREDDEWIYEWTKKNPVPEGEMNHEEYNKASEHGLFKGLSKDPETYKDFRKTYQEWGDMKGLGRMMKVVHDAGLSNINMHTCQDCNFYTQATNKLCPFCKRHMKEIHNPYASDGEQAYGSRAVHRLAKTLIVDNNNPGCAFSYKGEHSLMWRQMTRLLK